MPQSNTTWANGVGFKPHPSISQDCGFISAGGEPIDINDVFMMSVWTLFWIEDVRGFWWEVMRSEQALHRKAWTFTGKTRTEEFWMELLVRRHSEDDEE